MRRTKTVLMRILALSITCTFLVLFACHIFLFDHSSTEILSTLILKQGVASASEVNNENAKLVIEPDFGVYSVAFSPDGKYIAAGGDHLKACIWDVETGKLVRTLNHNAVVQVVTYSPDGKYLATGTWDTYKVKNHETVNIWDAKTGNLISSLSPTIKQYNAGVNSMSFSSDNKYLSVSYVGLGKSADIAMFNLNTMKLHKLLEDDRGAISIKFYTDNKHLVYGNHNEEICIHNIELNKCGDKISTGFKGWINAVDVSLDGKFIAAAGADKVIKIWLLQTKETAQILKGHTGWIRAITFSPDGRYLVSASDDRTVMLWDIRTGHVIKILAGWRGIFSVTFSQNYKYFAAGGNERITIWTHTQ